MFLNYTKNIREKETEGERDRGRDREKPTKKS